MASKKLLAIPAALVVALVMALTPNATSYTKTLTADTWDDATFWWDGTVSSHFTVNQTFTVQTIDINNRVVWLSG